MYTNTANIYICTCVSKHVHMTEISIYESICTLGDFKHIFMLECKFTHGQITD